MSPTENPRPPFPPFDAESAAKKVRLAEDAWNTRDPERVSLAYTPDSTWRNRSEFLSGREAIVQFLTRKWNKELDYRLIKELWAFNGSRIAVRFAYEWHTTPETGFAPTATRTGSSMSMALCGSALPASTTSRFGRVTESITGRSVVAPTSIHLFPISAYDAIRPNA